MSLPVLKKIVERTGLTDIRLNRGSSDWSQATRTAHLQRHQAGILLVPVVDEGFVDLERVDVVEREPGPRQHLAGRGYPDLPKTRVKTTSAADYAVLVAGSAA